MNEPVFLSREAVDLIHESSLRAFGGADGVRDYNALESALAQPMHVPTKGRASRRAMTGFSWAAA